MCTYLRVTSKICFVLLDLLAFRFYLHLNHYGHKLGLHNFWRYACFVFIFYFLQLCYMIELYSRQKPYFSMDFTYPSISASNTLLLCTLKYVLVLIWNSGDSACVYLDVREQLALWILILRELVTFFTNLVKNFQFFRRTLDLSFFKNYRAVLCIRTAFLYLQLQLQSLMETLSTTEPHYIRCVKPNSVLKPAIFENLNIMQQLRCGVSILFNLV